MKYKEEIEKGEKLFAEGQIEQAFSVFNNILENQPNNHEALNNLGVICHVRGNVEEAEDYFLKAFAVKNDHLDALLNLVDLYQETKRWEDAATQLEKCIAINTQEPNFYNQLGMVYLEMSNSEKARQTLAKSLELNPDQKIVRDSLRSLEEKVAAPKIKISENPLNILFVQEAPCIRNYKMATALRSRGHKVSLAYTKARLSQMYKGLSDDVYDENIHIANFRQIWDISKNYDIVHCHNEPDTFTVAALAGDAPVVHDTHDLISLRTNGDPNLPYFEAVANRGAAGRVYATPYQLEEAKRLYGVNGPSLVFYNYASESDLPSRFLPKLSVQDGNIHIVYEGGIGGNTHRDFSSLFVDLAKKGIHIHIYPTFYNQEIAQYFSTHKTIHYYHPLSPKQIMEEMTQYDFGIIPFNLKKGNKRFLDSTIANKLFEYMAAGLPVITSPLKTYIDYFKKNPIGITFENAQDIIGNIPKLKKIAEKTDFSEHIFTYEGEIGRLEEFYNEILNDYPRRFVNDVGSIKDNKQNMEGINAKIPLKHRKGNSDKTSYSAMEVSVEEIHESRIWNTLVNQTYYAFYSHSAEYDDFAFDGGLKKIKISINDEVYIVSLEITKDLACSFSKYYGGIIPLTSYKHITEAYDVLCQVVKNSGLSGLLLSYIQKLEYEFVKILEDHISGTGGQKVEMPNWTHASIMFADRPYQRIWDSVYSAKTRNMIRKAGKNGIECRIINILDHVQNAVDCTLSKQVRHGSRLPDYYYDTKLFRQTMEKWQKIFGTNMISFGAFLGGKLIAYINTFVRCGEAIANNMLSHGGFLKMAPNNALFDHMIKYFTERDEVRWIMYSFETLESVDRFKHSMGFEPVPVHRWLVQFSSEQKRIGGNYSKWLKEMVAQKSNFLIADEVIDCKKIVHDRPNVVIRHDIDFSPPIALKMAEAESKLGVRSTFYVFTADKYKIVFPVEQFQALEKLGWEIGYHTSTEHLNEALSDIKQLRQYYNIRTTVPHMGNLSICKGELRKYIKVLRDGQRFLVQDDGYIADNGGRLQKRVNIRDDGTNEWMPIQGNDIIIFIKHMKPGKVYHFLFHPCWYDENLNFVGQTPNLSPMQRPSCPVLKLEKEKRVSERLGNKMDVSGQKIYPDESEGLKAIRKEKSPSFYNRLFISGGWQKEYHKHYTKCNDYNLWKKILSWIKEVHNPKIIDIGCGPGQFANMLFDNGIIDYKGIDFSHEAIAMARERNKMFAHAFTKDNALTSKIFSNNYNMVLLLEVLEHIENDLAVLDKIKKNSTIIFSVPNFDSESHVRWFGTQDNIITRYGTIVEIGDIKEALYDSTINKIYLIKGIKK
jgi:tetratricopeptide (TPR) repeat protein